MKIFFIGRYNNTEFLSGPEKVAKSVFYNVSANNDSTVFVDYFFKNRERTNSHLRWLGKEIIQNNPKVIRLGLLRMFCFLVRHQPDIIHIITAERFIIPLFFYKFLLKSKIVVTFHGLYKHEIKYSRRKIGWLSYYKDILLEKLLTKVDKLVFLSEIHRNTFKKYYKIPEYKTFVIPNGSDLEFQNSKKTFKIPEEVKIVFYNGGAYNTKGDTELLHLLNECKFSSFIKLFVLGEKISIENNRYPFHINFVNKLSSQELISFLSDKDILINISKFEPFSLMAVEAMLAGLIVIATKNAGIAEYINDKENGFIFNSKEQFIDIFENIMTSKINLNKISFNASNIGAKLNWKSITQKYNNLYLELLR